MVLRRRFLLIIPGLSACTNAPRRPASAEREPGAAPPSEGIERAIFNAINAVRKREGAPELQWHNAAAEAAQSHSRAMAEGGFFSHEDPTSGDLRARMSAAGIRWSAVAENLFQQQGCADAVRCAIDGWLDSEGHRRNLLNPEYTHTGVGVSSDARGAVYYTQIFLTPAPNA